MATTSLSHKERYLLAARGETTDRPPVWLMRQAGRYMPQYQAVRRKHSFKEMSLTPELSAEVTLQPLSVLDIDILIIFNDILIPLEQMGLEVEFPEGGPRIIQPLRNASDLERFHVARFENPPVAQSIRLTKQQAPQPVPVLGFCGSPFTLACYAVEGRMSRDQREIKSLMYREPKLLHEILSRLTETAANYLISQIEDGGADGVQVFESWGGVLSAMGDYEQFAAVYQRKLIKQVKAACPDTPLHLFVRQCSGVLESMAKSGADVLSIDWMISLAEARSRVDAPLQGNLDPMVLLVPDAVEAEVERMLDGFDYRRGFIANLGHGITPQASVEAAQRFVRAIQALA